MLWNRYDRYLMEFYRYLRFLLSVLIAGVLCAGCGKVAGDAIGAGDDGNDVGGTGADGDGRLELRLAPGFTKVAGDEFESWD